MQRPREEGQPVPRKPQPPPGGAPERIVQERTAEKPLQQASPMQVRIQIDHLEIRTTAAPSAPPPQRQAPVPAVHTLDAYLNRRNRGGSP